MEQTNRTNINLSTRLSLALVMGFLVVFSVVSPCLSIDSRGWGDDIKWKTFEEGKEEAKTSHRPMMMVIHKTWCGACKALKPKFAASKEIAELSKKFVMVNIQDDEEPKDPQFQQDGGYIPRIFFLDSFGQVQKDIINDGGNPSYKYFYGNANSIVNSMNSALDKMIQGVRIEDEL
ncbi:thioredoxin domain-containing protein 12-like [Actinia tenebrosa]|uniref:Thioredoxin domain-containing protein 12-like n=1 Tax=Actinia tenebrosa TaxID=6105 RepID=A0A6P8HUN3_ACTTE|nr:thioredoxin domain-containing protein 12-like [Actinia tenebrosa]